MRAWAPPLAGGVLCYGLAAGVWKHAGIDVGTFCVLFVIGKTVAGGALWVARGRPPIAARASWPFLGAALLAAVLNGLAWAAYFVAFERGPLAIVQTVTAAYTAVAAVLAVLFLGERLARAQVAGVALTIAAGVLLGYASNAAPAGAPGHGWLAASFAAMGLWGVAMVIAKLAYRLPHADDARFFLAHGLGLWVTVLPYGLWLAPSGPRGAGGAAVVVVALLYVAGELGIYAAIARGPASVVNPLTSLYPIPSIVYAALILGDVPDRLGWIAIAMVLPGMVLAVPGALGPLARLCGTSRSGSGSGGTNRGAPQGRRATPFART